jgi:hypothetical protein
VAELAWLVAFSDLSSALLLGQKSGSAILLREKLLSIFSRWRWLPEIAVMTFDCM